MKRANGNDRGSSPPEPVHLLLCARPPAALGKICIKSTLTHFDAAEPRLHSFVGLLPRAYRRSITANRSLTAFARGCNIDTTASTSRKDRYEVVTQQRTQY